MCTSLSLETDSLNIQLKNISLQFLKRRMSFEWRKGLHFLSIIWVLSLMNHAPQRIFWLVGVPFFIYCGGKLFGVVSRTYLLENCYFERLSDSFCLITFQNPKDFDEFNAAYVYLVLPWVSVSMELSFLDSLTIMTYRNLQSCLLYFVEDTVPCVYGIPFVRQTWSFFHLYLQGWRLDDSFDG